MAFLVWIKTQSANIVFLAKMNASFEINKVTFCALG